MKVIIFKERKISVITKWKFNFTVGTIEISNNHLFSGGKNIVE